MYAYRHLAKYRAMGFKKPSGLIKHVAYENRSKKISRTRLKPEMKEDFLPCAFLRPI